MLDGRYVTPVKAEGLKLVTPAKAEHRPCEGRGPSLRRSLGLDVGVIRHSLRSHGYLPAQV